MKLPVTVVRALGCTTTKPEVEFTSAPRNIRGAAAVPPAPPVVPPEEGLANVSCRLQSELMAKLPALLTVCTFPLWKIHSWRVKVLSFLS